MDKKLLTAIAGVVVVLVGVWFYLQTQDQGYMPAINTSEATNFARAVTLNFPAPSVGQATGTISYVENGVTKTRFLEIDSMSMCGGTTGALPCMAMSVSFDMAFDGKRAMVEGIEHEDVVVLRKLRILEANEPEMPAAPGDVFISWYHAIELLKACQVTLATQTHGLDVYLNLKDGRQVRAVEPMIDEVFKVIDQTKGACGDFPVATE